MRGICQLYIYICLVQYYQCCVFFTDTSTRPLLESIDIHYLGYLGRLRSYFSRSREWGKICGMQVGYYGLNWKYFIVMAVHGNFVVYLVSGCDDLSCIRFIHDFIPYRYYVCRNCHALFCFDEEFALRYACCFTFSRRDILRAEKVY